MNIDTLNHHLAVYQLPSADQWPAHYDAILITGPTASGKSALGMQLAQLWPADIISVDSALVYTGMDIGTAKPTRQEQSEVPHHLIDLIDPAQTYNVAQFLDDCQTALHHCNTHTRMPILVGGTMMYVNALAKGINALPQGSPDIRAEIERKAQDIGWPGLHQTLTQIDPVAAARIAPMDTQRIERALEVFYATGQSLTDWFAQNPPSTALMSSGTWLHLSIEPEKLTIWQRIEQRFDTMLQHGLIDEVKQLKARGDLHLDLPSMRCVGYRQAWQYLDGAYDLRALREHGVIATRQLAKRQMTWLRSMPNRLPIRFK